MSSISIMVLDFLWKLSLIRFPFKRVSFSLFFCVLGLFVLGLAPNEVFSKTQYRTSFGNCPSRVVGNLTLDLIKEYEKEHSLYDVKSKLVDENLSDKYFLDSYQINFDPITNILAFKYNCPTPVMRVSVVKENGRDSYSAVLADNGQLLDPTFEEILKQENKIHQDLPQLSLSVEHLGKKSQEGLKNLILDLDDRTKKKLSEVILDTEGELLIILSHLGRPTSVFVGKDDWSTKVEKLNKMIVQFEKNERFPSSINLSSTKKVVVKFLDNP